MTKNNQMYWYDEPMRWMQLNLVEDDPRTMDIEQWKRIWKNARVEGLTISAAGGVAFYPSTIPYQEVSSFLDGRDLLGEIIAAARESGIRVLARFEPCYLPESLFEEKPDWFRVDSHGRPMSMSDVLIAQLGGAENAASTGASASIKRLSGVSGHYMPCWEGPYYSEFIPAGMTDLANRYDIDGFYANAWPQPLASSWPSSFATACYCPTCTKRWSEFSGGQPYPTADLPGDALWETYIEFAQSGVERMHRRWQQHAKALNPQFSFVANTSGSVSTGIRWSEFGPLDLIANDCQGRNIMGARGTEPTGSALWMLSRSSKIIRAVAGDDRPAFHIVGAWQTGGPGRPSLRRLGMSPQELTTTLALTTAKGLRPWANVGGGTINDQRWVEPLENYYEWHASAEAYLRSRQSLARIGVVWDPRSCWPTRSPAGRPSTVDAINGWYLAMLRARIPFRFLPTATVTAADLTGLDVVVVPSGTELGAETMTIVESAAASIGVVLGCGLVTARDWTFEAPFSHDEITDNGSGYLRVDDPAHPLMAGIDNADYIPSGRWRAQGELGSHGVCTAMPALPFLADKAFFPEQPELRPLLRHLGRSVFLGTDVDALFGQTQLADPGSIITNTLTVAAQDATPPSPVQVDGPGLVDVEVWSAPHAVVVHLVNLTTPDLYGGALREVVAVGPLRIQVSLPAGSEPVAVRLLWAGRDAVWSRTHDSTVELEVSTLESYEAIAITTRVQVRTT